MYHNQKSKRRDVNVPCMWWSLLLLFEYFLVPPFLLYTSILCSYFYTCIVNNMNTHCLQVVLHSTSTLPLTSSETSLERTIHLQTSLVSVHIHHASAQSCLYVQNVHVQRSIWIWKYMYMLLACVNASVHMYMYMHTSINFYSPYRTNNIDGVVT